MLAACLNFSSIIASTSTSSAYGQVGLGTVGQDGENRLTVDRGRVQFHNDVLTVPMHANSQEGGVSACQKVMAVAANVVVGVQSCRYPKSRPVN
jgi:hypothetical protein